MSYKEIQAAEMKLSEYGVNGATFIKDTATHTGKWRMFKVITACTFTTLTSSATLNGSSTLLLGSDLPATIAVGTVIALPNITEIKLSAGAIIAYS